MTIQKFLGKSIPLKLADVKLSPYNKKADFGTQGGRVLPYIGYMYTGKCNHPLMKFPKKREFCFQNYIFVMDAKHVIMQVFARFTKYQGLFGLAMVILDRPAVSPKSCKPYGSPNSP